MPSLPKKATPMQKQIETLRRRSDLELERRDGKPLPEKAKQDQAILDSVGKTKH